MSYIVKNPENLFKKRVFFFGYGSLMYPEGINKRGMTKSYKSDMMDRALLYDYKRGSYANYQGHHYYSLIEQSKAYVNGVIFEIFSYDDLDILLKDEGAHEVYRKTEDGVMYELAVVTDRIFDLWIPFGAHVVTLVHPPYKPAHERNMDAWYVNTVWNGIQMWGRDFIKKFLETGGEANVSRSAGFIP